MKRRQFLQAAGIGVAAAAVAKPAIAQSTPQLKWRLTSSFPKSLDTIYSAAEIFAKAVAEATDNKFQIQVFAAGELVPGLQAADAVGNGTVEMAHTASYYYVGKDPTFAFGTAVPFGLNSRMQNAWQYFGGGMDLMNDFYKKYNIYGIPCGNTGCQMGGWFRKEIKEPGDFNGLKFRIGGYAGRVLQKLGFQKVAPYYYYPGWWEGGAMLHNFINIERWNALTPTYKSVVRTCSDMASMWMQAKYDAANPAALKRLVGAGAKLQPFSPAVMDACLKAALELYHEVAATNPDFKKGFDSTLAFRNDQYLWWQVAEYTYDGFLIRNRTRT